MQVGRSSIPPRTTAIHSAAPGTLDVQTQRHKFAAAGPGSLPLPPQQAAQPSPYPAIEVLQSLLALRELEVIDPTAQQRVKSLDRVCQRPPTPTAQQFAYALRQTRTLSGAIRSRVSRRTVKLNPRNLRSQGRATALL